MLRAWEHRVKNTEESSWSEMVGGGEVEEEVAYIYAATSKE